MVTGARALPNAFLKIGPDCGLPTFWVRSRRVVKSHLRTPYLRQLDKVVAALEAKSDEVSVPKPPLDAEEVWARWRTLAFDLSKLDSREIRTLCVSPMTATKSRLVSALGSNPDAVRRWINLNGFVQAYFAQWRTMENPEVVEKLVQNMLSGSMLRRSSKFLDLWRKSPFLFSAEASRRVGRIILKDHKSVIQSCAEYCIDPSSALAGAAQEYAAVAAVDELIQHDARLGPLGSESAIVSKLPSPGRGV